MASTVFSLTDRVAIALIDKNYVRWSKENHVNSLNDAISTIVMMRPDLSIVVESVEVAAGQCRIRLPADAYKLLSVNHFDGIAIIPVSLSELNWKYPSWRVTSGTPSNWVKHDTDELTFFLFPQPENAGVVEVEYSRLKKVADDEAIIPLPDIYEPLLFDYMMYRAYSRDGQNESEQAKANTHLQAFQLALTGKTQSDNTGAKA
ncbi:hypothetical protein CSW98_01570 [Vibrio sp. HA2012]|uniref:phage adaptor protein n=1 Tax=Vibrio sp. HA2012 TaxID=1971595 RepID=UPI000C2B9564|nr:DUF6682 family protein [Vibrio sp. HA2012]PJC87840.1 hypothetical protein CSW98_01570 [Vibrio sp. HA2012]